jgi:hypothetical protein
MLEFRADEVAAGGSVAVDGLRIDERFQAITMLQHCIL